MSDSDLVYNERIKSLSTLFHNLAVLFIGAGAVYPLIAANQGKDPALSYLTTFPIALLAGLCLATIGQLMLKSLRG